MKRNSGSRNTRQEGIARIQTRAHDGLDQERGGGEKSYSACILKIESIEFSGGLNLGSGKKYEVKDDIEGFWPEQREEWVAGFEDQKRSRFGGGREWIRNFVLDMLSLRCRLKIQVGYMSLEFRLGLDIYSWEASDVPPHWGTRWLTFGSGHSCVRQVAVSSASPQVQIGYKFTSCCLAFSEAYCSPEVSAKELLLPPGKSSTKGSKTSG